MSKLLAVVLTVAALVLSIPVGKVAVDTLRSGGLTQEKTNTFNGVSLKIPDLKDLLNENPPKAVTVAKTLVLETKNTYVFRGPVTGSSVGQAMKAISTMSRNLSKSDIIYLVLDTPGGSVFDGLDFIDFLEAVPQEIRTVTLFAASMGFQIVENNPGKRIIARQGTLMSHRAAGGMEGQFDGEFESRYRMVKRKIDYLEVVDAARMGVTLTQYKSMIVNELWVHGFDAVEQKVADDVTLLQCGTTMVGEDKLEFQTMFGAITVVFDKCPLIREPTRIEMQRVRQDARGFVFAQVKDAFYNKTKFVKEVILKGQFNKVFP